MIILDNPDYFIYDGITSKDKQVYILNDGGYQIGGLPFASVDKTIFYDGGLAYYKSKLQGKTITKKVMFICEKPIDESGVVAYIQDINSWLGSVKPKKLTFKNDLGKYYWATISDDINWDITDQGDYYQGISTVVFEMPIFAYANDSTVVNDTVAYEEYVYENSVNDSGVDVDKTAIVSLIQGNSEVEITAEEQVVVDMAVSDTLKNTLINDNGQKRIDVKVGQVSFDGSESWQENGDSLSNDYIEFRISDTYFNNFTLNYITNITIHNIRKSTGVYVVSIFKTDFIGYDFSLTATEKLNLFKTFLTNTPLTVTYELAVKNPKTVNSNVLSNYLLFTEVDYYMYDLPIDIKPNSDIMVDGVKYQYKVSNNGNILDVGYWMITSTNQLRIMVEKNKFINNPITLTYELATPRLADTVGIASVENPVVESVGKNLFDKSLPYTLVNSTNLRIDGIKLKSNYQFVGVASNINGDSNIRIFPTALNVNEYVGNLNSSPFYTNDSTDYSLNIYFVGGVSQQNIQSILDSIMLNKGTVALPYEPYFSTQLSLTETLNGLPSGIRDEAKPVDGVYQTTKKLVKVDLWSYGNITNSNILTNYYNFDFVDFVATKSIKSLDGINNQNIMLMNTFPYLHSSSSKSRHFYVNVATLRSYIEKPLIDIITFASMTAEEKLVFPTFVDPLTLVQKFQVYLYRNTIQGIFEKAVYETYPTPTTLSEPLPHTLHQGGTIYLDSDKVLPTVTYGAVTSQQDLTLTCVGNIDITEPKITLSNFSTGVLNLSITHKATNKSMQLYYPVTPTDIIVINNETKNVFVNGSINNAYFDGEFIQLLGKKNFSLQENILEFRNDSVVSFDINITYQDMYI